MGQTYTYRDAINLIRRHISAVNEDDYAAEIVNAANRKIWMAYDWRETIEKLPPFWIIPNEQDHGAPMVSIPTDFMGIRLAYLTQLSQNPPSERPLQPVRDLRVTQNRDYPRDICYNPESNSFRLFPRVPDNLGAPDWIVHGTYKKVVPKYNSSDFAGATLLFDDMYFMNYLEVLKWAGWKLAGDTRAGQVQAGPTGVQIFTGQAAEAQAAMEEMAKNEGLELSDPVIAPLEPLAGSGDFSLWGGYNFGGW